MAARLSPLIIIMTIYTEVLHALKSIKCYQKNIKIICRLSALISKNEFKRSVEKTQNTICSARN